MRIKQIIVLTSLLIFPGFLYGQESFQELFPHVPIDFAAIRLNPPFTVLEDTQRKWKELVLELLHLPDKFYDTTIITKLMAFIAAHPSDTTAISAKFYLAEYLQRSRLELASTFNDYLLESEAYEQDLQVATELVNLVTEDMLRVYQELAAEAPELWQGKLASHYTREYFDAMEEKGATYRAKRRALWPLLRNIQHEQDFHFIQILEGESDPVEVSISAEYIWFALEENNFVEAETELAHLKSANYPHSLETIEQADREITKAYKDQFDGGYGPPEEELLHLLISSQNTLEVRQVAAALGNLDRTKVLRMPEGGPEIINKAVLGYITRAMTGDAAERDAMIELIYRLWYLAVPALLETLDADDADRVAFTGERLLYMRNEEIITAIIAKARAATDETKKAQLVGLLTRMNEPCVPVMRFRECLPDEQLQELYQRLVVPALEELQGQAPTPTP